MSSEPIHPSFLELDRAALGAPSKATREHLAACACCGSYVRRLGDRAPLPAWLSELEAQPRGFWRRFRLPVLGLGGALALASTAAIVVLETPTKPLIASKSAPTLTLYVKRADEVSVWDGHSPIAPGDRLRLRVAPEGLRQVLVASLADGRPSVLYRGALPSKGEPLLPESWQVDDSPGPEGLAVVLSADPIMDEQLPAIVRERPRTSKVWTTVLNMPKSARLPRAP